MIQLSSQVAEKDHLNILSDVKPRPQHQRQFNELLTKRNARSLAESGTDRAVICSGLDSIKHSSFARLNEGICLDDKSINYFLKRIIQPQHERTHCFSSFFFSTLLRDGYDFDAVCR